MKILLLENINQNVKSCLQEQELEFLTTSLSEKELIEKLQGVDILGIRSKTKVSKTVIENSNLKLICCFCIGTDQVDLNTATLHGIPVIHSPFCNTRSVAELVICQVIALSRKLIVKNQEVHSQVWNKNATNCHEVRGKTLGVVGYGHVGSQVSVLAESLGMNVLFYDIVNKLPLGNAKSVSFNQLLSQSDFLSLHVPLTDKTRNLITEKELSMIKKGSYLLNLSRGEVVDLEALRDSLINNHLTGASVDVYPQEPEKNGEFSCCLQNIPNVILTPHIGGSTEEAQSLIAGDLANKIYNFIHHGILSDSVNLPNVNCGPKKNNHRVIHIHKNEPGVLKKIHSLISTNIQNEILHTNSKVGYLVMDLDELNMEEFSTIMSLPETVKLFFV